MLYSGAKGGMARNVAGIDARPSLSHSVLYLLSSCSGASSCQCSWRRSPASHESRHNTPSNTGGSTPLLPIFVHLADPLTLPPPWTSTWPFDSMAVRPPTVLRIWPQTSSGRAAAQPEVSTSTKFTTSGCFARARLSLRASKQPLRDSSFAE